MSKKLIIKKGYTIEVTSWENDGDNYNIKTLTVENKEYALAVLQMCKDIFVSCNNGDDGIGNMNDNEYEDGEEIILNYVSDKPIITKNKTDPYVIFDIVMNINYELLGSSEYYFSRVFESGVIYYSPKDIYLEEIK